MPRDAMMRHLALRTAVVLAGWACLGSASVLGATDAGQPGAEADGWTIDPSRPQEASRDLKSAGTFALPSLKGKPLVCWVRSTAGLQQFQIIGLGPAAPGAAPKAPVTDVRSDPMAALAALVVPEGVTRLQVVFGQAGGPATDDSYTLRCSATDVARTIVKSGYAVKYAVSPEQYLDVDRFARPGTDAAERKAAREKTSAVRALLAKIVGGDVFEGEPVVLFVGTAGLARILVVEAGAQPHPDRDNLDPTKAIWAAYIEDDGGPYETSVDVQFNRSSRIKYDQFEPGTTPLSAAAALARFEAEAKIDTSAMRPRTVRVGIKRIPLTLPMSMQVAFTRQGGLYGFRQWQKSLRVRRGWADVSVSVVAPATEVTLNTHSLVRTDFPVDGNADFNTIDQDSRRRQVFAALRLGWPGVRAATNDARRTAEALKTAWVPDLVLGIGLPPTKATAAYAGLSWPVPGVRRLHLSAGATILWQSRLKAIESPYIFGGQTDTKPLAVGTKVPLEWTNRSIASGSTPVAKFVFGLVVDLFTWP